MDGSVYSYRRYVPVLKDMPLRYLFEPWKAPKPVQEKAKCVIGKDYPAPMVDHKAASTECMKNMQEVADALIGKGNKLLVIFCWRQVMSTLLFSFKDNTVLIFSSPGRMSGELLSYPWHQRACAHAQKL